MPGLYRKAVFIIAYKISDNKIKYLLLKRKLHWKGWEFPKGGIETGEDMKKAAKRELNEETNQDAIKLISYNKSGKYKYEKEYADRPGFIGQTYSLFAAQVKGNNVKLDKKEHSEFKWLDFDSAFNKLKWLNQKVCLNIVNKSLIKK